MSHARTRVEDWVAAGLSLQRGAAPSVELLTASLPDLEATLEVLPLLPPLGVVADLARLISRAPFDIAKSEAVADAELRAALDAYEEHVLGRLAADPRLELARDALAGLDESLRPAATAVFIEQILGRLRAQTLHEPDFDAPGPTAIRRALARHPMELVELGASLLAGPDDALRASLAARYAELSRGARRSGALIEDVELFTLENHQALRAPSQRLAMAQIAEAARAIERTLPVRVRRSGQGHGRTHTRIEDESTYPIGGYSSISTVGGMESLVSSELIYMSSPGEVAMGDIDLFEVRWAAGELLKYTRDESVHTRERRTLSFALSPALDHSRVKDSAVPWQRLVACMGGVVALVRKLCAWLDEAELHLHILLVADSTHAAAANPQPLAPEAALARLVLREYVESGTVEFVELEGPHAAREHAAAAAEHGGSDLIWLLADTPEADQGEGLGALLPDPDPAPDPTGPRRHREHGLSVGRAQPTLWIDDGRGTAPCPQFFEGWEAWTQAFLALGLALVD